MIDGDLPKKTVFIIYTLSYLIYMLVGTFFVVKAGSLVGNKKRVRMVLIVFIITMTALNICSMVYNIE